MLVRFRPRLGGRCFSHCIMFGKAIQENPCEQKAVGCRCRLLLKQPVVSIFCAFQMDLSTFSTGFSTEFVKKRASFPRCFPLFPPSFPLLHRLVFIREVFPGIFHGGFWGEMRELFLFSKRKSSRFLFFFHRLFPAVKCFLPAGMQAGQVFHIGWDGISSC